MTANRRRLLGWTLALLVGVLLASATWIASRSLDHGRLVEAADPAAGLEHEEPYEKDRQLVLDAAAGWRPRRSVEFTFRIAPLGGEPAKFTRHHDRLGLIRRDDVPATEGSPRVLLVGDSHLMGVVDTEENAASLLERRLRERPGLERAVVLNGSAGYYSLWQQVLRARSLLPVLRPDLVILAPFLGNDFLELEDVGRPHLDDAGAERAADPEPPPETTSQRFRRLGLDSKDLLFSQGLNQACYFMLHPERLEPVLAKARRCVEVAASMATEDGPRTIVAPVPSYDLVFPDRACERGPAVAEVVRAGTNATVRDGFVKLLSARGVTFVDPTAAMRTDGRDALYATDYHIHVAGHRLLADVLVEPVVAALRETGR